MARQVSAGTLSGILLTESFGTGYWQRGIFNDLARELQPLCAYSRSAVQACRSTALAWLHLNGLTLPVLQRSGVEIVPAAIAAMALSPACWSPS